MSGESLSSQPTRNPNRLHVAFSEGRKRLFPIVREVGNKLRARLEERRILREADKFGITNKEMLKLILDGYYEGSQWALHRFRMKRPRLTFDSNPPLFVPKGSLGSVFPGGKIIFLSGYTLRGLQERFAATKNTFAAAAPEKPPTTTKSNRKTPSLEEIGQEFGVEEITHCAQFQQARDRMTGKRLSAINKTITETGSGTKAYNTQTHETEAWKYKWLFYQHQVKRGKLSSNPLNAFVASIGINTTHLR